MKCQFSLVLIFAKFGKWLSSTALTITADTFQSPVSNLGGEMAPKLYYVSKFYYVFKILPCGAESEKATQRGTRVLAKTFSSLFFH